MMLHVHSDQNAIGSGLTVIVYGKYDNIDRYADMVGVNMSDLTRNYPIHVIIETLNVTNVKALKETKTLERSCLKTREDSVSLLELREDSVSLLESREDSVSSLLELREDSVSSLLELREDSVPLLPELREDSVSSLVELTLLTAALARENIE